MEKIMVNEWGKQIPAFLTDWEHIKAKGFELRDRSFGQLNDGTPCLYFSNRYIFPKHSDDKNVYITTEKWADLMERENN